MAVVVAEDDSDGELKLFEFDQNRWIANVT
jgi:hypothetical protein